VSLAVPSPPPNRTGGRAEGRKSRGDTAVPPSRPLTAHTDLQAALTSVRAQMPATQPRTAIVLGSGLGGLAESVERCTRIPFADIDGFPEPSVAGHRGELVFGTLAGTPVVLQNGRFHLYEGHEPSAVALPVRLLAELGVRNLIVTNAAGGLNPRMRPPTLMLISDHINLMWRNPLVGNRISGETRWPDMCEPYARELRDLAADVALREGILVHEGVYGGVLGPCFETPAEISMLRRLGCDAVGMSTVPEALAAVARGLRVVGISSVTNAGAGLSGKPLSHAEVLEAGQMLATRLEVLVRGVVARLD